MKYFLINCLKQNKNFIGVKYIFLPPDITANFKHVDLETMHDKVIKAHIKPSAKQVLDLRSVIAIPIVEMA